MSVTGWERQVCNLLDGPFLSTSSIPHLSFFEKQRAAGINSRRAHLSLRNHSLPGRVYFGKAIAM